MDLEALKALGGMGVGGVLAGMMFLFYRKDFLRQRNGSREAQERRDRRDDLMIDVVARNASALEGLRQAIEYQGQVIREALDRQARDLAEIIREVRR